jgi:hypothetical protein
MPEPQPYEWKSVTDRDKDALAVLAATVDGNEEGVASVLATLDRQQALEIVSVLAGWWCWAVGETSIDAAEHLKRVALDVAVREAEGRE